MALINAPTALPPQFGKCAHERYGPYKAIEMNAQLVFASEFIKEKQMNQDSTALMASYMLSTSTKVPKISRRNRT